MEAEDRALRLPSDLGREPGHADVHFLHELRHRLLDGTLVIGAVALEPRLRVVPRNPAQEAERFGVEVAHDCEGSRGKAPVPSRAGRRYRGIVQVTFEYTKRPLKPNGEAAAQGKTPKLL